MAALLSHVFSWQSVFFCRLWLTWIIALSKRNKIKKKCLHHVNTTLNVSGSWDRVIARWYRHRLQAGDAVPFESSNPKADYCASAAVSLFHRNPRIQKKKTTPSENIFLLLLSPVEEKHLAHSAKRLFFSERSRFLQTEGFAQNELLLIAIKLRQSTAEETEGCPLDPIQSKPVLTPAVPYLYCSVSLLCCTKSALNVIYLAVHQERGPAAKLAAEATNLSHIAMVANMRLDSYHKGRGLSKGRLRSRVFLSLIFWNSVSIIHS